MNQYTELYNNLEELRQSGYFEKQNKPTEVTIKQNQFDINKLNEYVGEEFKTFEFRPQTFEQFIGQKEAKERAKTIIKKAKKKLKSHFLVDGIKGHGKTCYVELIAKELNAHLIKRIGRQIEVDNLVEIINEINNSKSDYVMFFVDEIDTMNWKVIKVLNPIIESFEICGKRIKPFIFVGATINKYILINKNPDTLDRIPIHIKFSRYNTEEITQILNQYISYLYSNEKINLNDVKIISENCKFNPRTAIGLLDELIVEKDINKVLNNCHIIKNGLTTKDLEILQTLNKSKRALGANCLAMKCKLSEKEYLTEFEPFLLEYDFINRVPSRIITNKGKELLNELLTKN